MTMLQVTNRLIPLSTAPPRTLLDYISAYHPPLPVNSRMAYIRHPNFSMTELT